MIMRTLFFLLLLTGSVWFGVQLHQNPGYVLIAINYWTIETTLWIALLLLFVGFMVFHFIINALRAVRCFPLSFKLWRAKQQVVRARNKTRKGLIEFSEGYWPQAKKHLINALPNTETPLCNYLMAARAAQAMGDSSLRDNYLREAQQTMPEAKMAVALTQAQLQLENCQWEQALATLRHLQDLAPKHPYVLTLLMQLYQEVQDWEQLILLLPELKRHQIVSGTAYAKLQKQVYEQALIEQIQQNNREAAQRLFQSLPKTISKESDLVAVYVHFLLKQHDNEQAELLLRRALNRQFNEALIDLYGCLPFEQSHLRYVESYIKKQPHSARLYLCLGRLSKAGDLWGKAKTYFEQSIALGESPQAYAQLAALLENLNDPAGAATAYRKGLELAVQSSD